MSAGEQASPATRSRIEGGVGVVEICRPPHNFLDAAILVELVEAIEEVAAADECRAIVLCSEGKSFCGGGNFVSPSIRPSAEDASFADLFRENAGRMYSIGARIFDVATPIVAAVHGAAVGAGFGLTLACDLRVTCPQAFFLGNFVRLGLHPGFGVSVTLPALVGPSRAADMLLTGRRVPGDEALRMGLADRVVPAEQVRDAALTLAGQIAEAAPLAVAATRASLRTGLADRVRGAMDREIEEQARLIGTADAAEGVAAMLQGRPPTFTGR